MEQCVILLLGISGNFDLFRGREILIGGVLSEQHLLLKLVEVNESEEVINDVDMNFLVNWHFVFEPNVKSLKFLI